MNSINRRAFLQKSATLSLMTILPLPSFSKPKERLFKMSLNPGAIGVQLNATQLVDAAIEIGFEAIVPPLSEMLDGGRSFSETIHNKMQKYNISWDAAGLPVEFRKDEETFRKDLQKLVKYGELMKDLDIKKCSTWIMPTHASLTYLQNFKQHSSRLSEVSKVLADFDIKLGLEYVGPKTLMALEKHPFISSMAETRELISETKSNNIGIQLDSFHWYCAEETKGDLLSLSADEIITCDLNDAVKGRSINEQLDYQRELPGMSGVIDLKSFLDALITIKYDGGIRAEPFNAKLNEMDNFGALKLTRKQMESSFGLIN